MEMNPIQAFLMWLMLIAWFVSVAKYVFEKIKKD